MIAHPQIPNGSYVAAAANEEMDRKPPSSKRFIPEPLLDSDQAAAIMQIHPKTLQRLARKGSDSGIPCRQAVALPRNGDRTLDRSSTCWLNWDRPLSEVAVG